MSIFEPFKPLNDSFSVVNLYIFEETYISLESPFHAELNGSLSQPRILKYP